MPYPPSPYRLFTPFSTARTYIHITLCRFIPSSSLLEKGPVAVDGFCCSGHETSDGSRPRQGWNGRTTVCRQSRLSPARKVKNNSVIFSRELFIVARRVAKGRGQSGWSPIHPRNFLQIIGLYHNNRF